MQWITCLHKPLYQLWKPVEEGSGRRLSHKDSQPPLPQIWRSHLESIIFWILCTTNPHILGHLVHLQSIPMTFHMEAAGLEPVNLSPNITYSAIPGSLLEQGSTFTHYREQTDPESGDEHLQNSLTRQTQAAQSWFANAILIELNSLLCMMHWQTCIFLLLLCRFPLLIKHHASEGIIYKVSWKIITWPQ